ncbi:MAG: hypothetical protein HC840_19615 [Leptolyngbyaceae cyanobacterium RM2_2_4]|nr:hypothetical protein [Leptolyngbyaceae cyanobacterium RM2_2_4]
MLRAKRADKLPTLRFLWRSPAKLTRTTLAGSAATASPIVARIQGLLVWKWELYRKLETMQAEV